MTRILDFLPSIVTIAWIAGVARFFVQRNAAQYGDNFNDPEWLEKNAIAYFRSVGIPTISILGPCVEELIFRAPLILYFDEMTTEAWYGIWVSAGFFAAAHAFGSERSTEKPRRRILHFVTRIPSGLLFGYAGVRLQSIWVAVALHATWNVAVLVAAVLAPLLASLGVICFQIVYLLAAWLRDETKYRIWKWKFIRFGK